VALSPPGAGFMGRAMKTETYLTPKQLQSRWLVSRATVSRLMRRMRVWRPSRTLVRIPMSEVERMEQEWMR